VDATRLYWDRVRGAGQKPGGEKEYRNRNTPPKCAFCNDAGVIRPDVDYPIGDTRFAQLVACPMCNDKTSQGLYLRKVCNLPAKLKDATFEGYYYTTESRVRAAPLAQELIDRRAGWLTLWGGYGSGKSYCAAATVNYSIARGVEARFWEMASLLDHLRDAYNPKSGPGFSSLFHEICECPGLVVDECDVFKPTDWAYAQFRQLVSHRYSNSTRLATIWALNPEPRAGAKNFPAELDFLASRMSEYPIIAFNDGDVRPL
jgi:hypothetical protein